MNLLMTLDPPAMVCLLTLEHLVNLFLPSWLVVHWYEPLLNFLITLAFLGTSKLDLDSHLVEVILPLW